MAGVCRSKLLFGHPVVTILGCTGTGKSKLAIEIAKRFNGEIINADAMQLYQGLDVITNKVTAEEQEGIQHHLLGFLNPLKTLTVCEYKNLALSKIKEIIDRNKLPIIVGGTFYYVESVLYDFVIGATDSPNLDEIAGESTEERLPRKRLKVEEYVELQDELDKLDNEKLHERLMEVDPEMAEKTHPNSRRKILRGIMAYHQYGEPLSSILEKQRSQPGGCGTGGPLRFTNAVILWLQCDSAVLNKRLNDRVDDMLSRGLAEELLQFYKAPSTKEFCLEMYNIYVDGVMAGGCYPAGKFTSFCCRDYKKGIFQSIGLKEFHDYLNLEDEQRESEEGKKSFEKGVELLRIATRQYAKQQTKWMQNRFIRNGQRQIPPIYSLDSTDVSKWDENVYKIAENIVECHIAGKKPSVEPLPVENTKTVVDKIYKCECGVLLSGKLQYEEHRKSKKHFKKLKRKERLEKEAEEKLAQAAELPNT